MKTADVRAMSADQIDDEVLKLKKEQFNLRFQRATGQLENTSRVRVVRRDIARLKTIAGQKNASAKPAAGEVATPSARKTRTKKASGKPNAPRPKQKLLKSKKAKLKKSNSKKK